MKVKAPVFYNQSNIGHEVIVKILEVRRQVREIADRMCSAHAKALPK